MSFCKQIHLARVLIPLAIVLVAKQVCGQKAVVTRISAQTGGGVEFSIWVRPGDVREGRSVIVYYKVENRSPQTIYLVHDDTAKPIAERGGILVQAPFVSLGGHEGYDYRFTRVGSGRSRQGRITISKDTYGEGRAWDIAVGFGYVTDIKGLDRQLEQGEDPLPMKALLDSRIKTLSLGRLSVEIL